MTEELAMAAPMFAGFKMSAKMVFPEGALRIHQCDLSRMDDTVTLMSMDFDKMMENEGGIKASLKKLEADSREDFAAVVKELDGDRCRVQREGDSEAEVSAL